MSASIGKSASTCQGLSAKRRKVDNDALISEEIVREETEDTNKSPLFS